MESTGTINNKTSSVEIHAPVSPKAEEKKATQLPDKVEEKKEEAKVAPVAAK
jgi:hypothetical protein